MYVYIRNKQIQFQAYTHLKWGLFPPRYIYMKVYNKFIDNSQEVETTNPTTSGNMLK